MTLPSKSARSSLLTAAINNAPLLLALTSLFWAGNAVIARGMHEAVPPVALAFFRWAFATLFLLPFAWKHLRQDWAALKEHWRSLVFLGVLGTGSFNTLYYIGIDQTPAVNALVLNSALPVFIALSSLVFFGDRLSLWQIAGILVSTAGVLCVITKGDVAALASFAFTRGDLWVIAAMSVWGVYTAFLRDKPKVHWLSFAAATFAIAAIVNLPLFGAEMARGRFTEWSVESVLTLLYVAIFPSIIAYTFYTRGVELAGANRAAVYSHLVPLFGAVMSIAFLGEALEAYHIAGFALIVVGVTVAAR